MGFTSNLSEQDYIGYDFNYNYENFKIFSKTKLNYKEKAVTWRKARN